jgi:type IX secretion system PorP/SprF family membrane protein
MYGTNQLNRMLNRCLFLLLFVSIALSSKAQDPTFSQSASNLLLLNPSFAGSTGEARANVSYRDQWPKLNSGSYTDVNASYDQYIARINGGIGINFLADNAGSGTIKTNRVDLAYAQQFHLFDHKLTIAPSLDLAYIQSTVDFSQLTFGSMINPRRGFGYTTGPEGQMTKANGDVSAGALFYTKHLCAGFSVYHLNTPDMGFFGPSKLPVRYTANLSYSIPFMSIPIEVAYLAPSILYKYQAGAEELVPALSVKYKVVCVGFGYRRNDATIFMAGYRGKRFAVSYSYDYTTSSLTNTQTGGTQELSVQVFLFIKHKPENYLAAPRFF